MVQMVSENPAKRGEARHRLRSRVQVPVSIEKTIVTGEDSISKEKDMNLGLKTLSKECHKKVESEDVQMRLVCSKLNNKTRDQEEGQWKKAVMAKLILLLLLGPSPSQATNPTEQVLPPDCLHWLEHHGCPDPSSFDGFWAHLNETCCKGYPGIFHCRMMEEFNGTYVTPACLLEQLVLPGKIGKLTKNTTGYPELDMDTDCLPGEFRSQATKSSLIWYSSCKKKTIPRREEEKICDGGSSADDLLVCKVGYNSSCSHAFNDGHDSCFCKRLHCEGLKPFRNLSGVCNVSSSRVEYGCTTTASPRGKSTVGHPTTGSTSGPLSSSAAYNTSATATGQDQDGNLSAGQIAGIVLVTVVGVVAFLGYCCCWANSQASSASGSAFRRLNDDNL